MNGGRAGVLRGALAALAFLLCTATALAAPPSFGQRETLGAGQNPTDLASADFDGDGDADIATTDFDGVGQSTGDEFGVDVFTSDAGDLVFQEKIRFDFQPDQIVATNVDEGDDPDLVVGTLTGEVLLLRGTAGAGFASPVEIDAGGRSPREVAVGDFTGDGRADIVAGRQDADDIVLIKQLKNGGFGTPKRFSGLTAPTAVRLNGDKRMDLVALSRSGQAKVRSLIATKNGFRRVRGAFAAGRGISDLQTGDVNRDGRADIVAVNVPLEGQRNVISVLLGRRDGAFARPQQVTVASGVTLARRGAPGGFPTSAAVRDLNADKLPDIAVTLVGYDRVSVVENRTRRGASKLRFGPADLLDAGTQPESIVATRLDSDAATDLAWVGEAGLSRVLDG